MNFKTLTKKQLKKIAKVDSPTVANVIELFGIRPQIEGYCDGRIKAIYPELPPTIGYAMTATFRSGYQSMGKDTYGGIPQYVLDSQSVPTPRIAVFQDLDDPPKSATYGEVMVSTFKKFGFTGLITSGAARDIEQCLEFSFPCWASSIIVSHGYHEIVEGNIPVNVAGMQVRPGDLIHADANGIINIPHSIAEGVVELTGPYMKAEQIVMDYLQEPDASPENYGKVMGKMRDRIAELKKQAQKMLEND